MVIKPEQPTVIRGQALDLQQAVMSLLPPTGSVEVQRDTLGREHPTHTHPVDETLLIVKGQITFQWANQEAPCGPGDCLHLPKETPHSSVAGPEGCLYIIALRP